MAISRTALVALMLPVPAAAYLMTTVADVSADTQCLPSAHAVRDAFPGAWASWSTHVANHHGVRCWFPVMREGHSRHLEVALHQAARRLQHHDHDATPAKDGAEAGTRPGAAPDAYAAQRSDLTWTSAHAPAPAEAQPASAPAPAPESAPSSFEDRFSAARDAVSGQRPSLIQHMMDPVGVVPDNP